MEKFLQYTLDTQVKFESEVEHKNEELSFLFKELNATFGVFSLESNVSSDLMNKGVSLFIIKLSLSYFDNPKLIKTSLGFLTNFSSNRNI